MVAGHRIRREQHLHRRRLTGSPESTPGRDAIASASSQSIAFAQENQGRVKRDGSSASTPSCIHPVPPVLFINMCRQASCSSSWDAVKPVTAIAIGQTWPGGVWGTDAAQPDTVDEAGVLGGQDPAAGGQVHGGVDRQHSQIGQPEQRRQIRIVHEQLSSQTVDFVEQVGLRVLDRPETADAILDPCR